jgi:dTDP-4-dehydrorhamnose 3,5-epimerase
MAITRTTPMRFVPTRHGDQRGWFCESFNRARMAELGVDLDFVQDNHSYSAARGTVRGIHFQEPPHGQAKLVRCLAGSIWDVAVDLRSGSPSYGKWVGTVLSARGGEQLFVPEGFGHGFMTLEDNVEVAYKASSYYAPGAEAGISWDDPQVGIAWPIVDQKPELSEKDRALPALRDYTSRFAYDGVPMADLD